MTIETQGSTSRMVMGTQEEAENMHGEIGEHGFPVSMITVWERVHTDDCLETQSPSFPSHSPEQGRLDAASIDGEFPMNCTPTLTHAHPRN